MKKLLVAVIMVVLATPAFAAIQNVKVSGDITSSFVYDNALNLGATGGSPVLPLGQNHQNVFLTQTRLRVDADLSDNVSTTVGLINERAWNAENIGSSSSSTGNALDTNVQLYLASITLREFLYSPLTLTIGRQVFNYGNGLIQGDGGPVNSGSANLAGIYADMNMRTAYDGVKATLDYKPLSIDLIYFKYGQMVGSVNGSFLSNPQQNADVYGYDANYTLSDPWSTVVEQYLFTRIDGSGFSSTLADSVGADSQNGGDVISNQGKGNTLYIPGLRVSTNPIKSLNVQGEVAWEFGNVPVQNNTTYNEAEHRDAMLAQLAASYSLPVLEKYKPTVNASFTYASGDKNSAENYGGSRVKSSKTYGAWDEFDTIQGAGTIYRSLFNLSDENILSIGASVAPLEDVTAAVTWTGLWAPVAYSTQNPLTLIQPNGDMIAGFGSVAPKNAHWVGNETDVNLTYNYTEDVTFGLNLGWFVPGDVFAASNKETASQAIANVGVKF
jgi:hypothetical protein